MMKRIQQDKERFAGRMFWHSLFPCMFSSVGLALSDMADAIVVGQRMGEIGLAAIGLALPVYMVINLFMHGLGSGGSIRFSRLLGEGKQEEARKNFSMILETGILLSICLSTSALLFLPQLVRLLGATPDQPELYHTSTEYIRVIAAGMPLFFISYLLNYYLRNADGQRLANMGFSIGNACDIFLNFLFVLCFDMGAAGAAWSTLIGQGISILLYGIGMKHGTYPLRFCLTVLDIPQISSCFRVGFSTSIQYGFQLFFLFMVNKSLIRRGGAAGVAVFDLIQNASYLPVYLYDGISKAAQPLLSTFLGEHNERGRRSIICSSLAAGVFLGTAASVFLFGMSERICWIFGLDTSEVMQLGSRALRVYSTSIVFAGCNILSENFYQACEQKQAAMYLAVLRGAFVLFPLTFIFSMCPISCFWWLFSLTECLSLLIFLIWIAKKKIKMDPFDPERLLEQTIEGKDPDIGLLTNEMEAFCRKWGYRDSQIFFTVMAAEEICLTILKKGFVNPSEGYIQVTLIASPEGFLELHIRDNAISLNPFSLEAAAVGDNEFDPETIGLYVIKKKAVDFFYRRYHGFNTMVIKI